MVGLVAVAAAVVMVVELDDNGSALKIEIKAMWWASAMNGSNVTLDYDCDSWPLLVYSHQKWVNYVASSNVAVVSDRMMVDY